MERLGKTFRNGRLRRLYRELGWLFWAMIIGLLIGYWMMEYF